MKIDLVYLWVDDSDPEWRARKDAALLAAKRPVPPEAVEKNRFQDNDELKYSLRSAEKFAPWINHIYIVTDRQIPKWLNVKNPKVTVVDHSEIFPEELKGMPVFNSVAIELFLQNIPGLSEHFLYANDDMFFGRPVSPDFFFDKTGAPIMIVEEFKRNGKVYTRGAAALNADAHVSMQANALRFAYEKTGIKFRCRIKHSVAPLRKSYLSDNLNMDYDRFVRTSATTFREKTGIQRLVFSLLDYAKGRGNLVYKYSGGFGGRTRYMRHVPPILIRVMLLLGTLFGGRKNVIDSRQKNVIAQIRRSRPEMFCLNYIAVRGRAEQEKTKEFLDGMFPEKSEFEK